MAKIAGLILPRSLEDRLPERRARLARAMRLYAGSRVESETYRGQRAVCLLCRVAPDPLNPWPQPADGQALKGVACGYYLAAGGDPNDSASRLLADLQNGGVAALARADGVFAFVYWDTVRERLVAGVDKLGMRPLYWTALPGGGYAVASEIKTLVALLDDLRINWAAWEEQLSLGFLFGEHTFFDGVQRFAPAECVTFRPEGTSHRIVEDFLATIDVVERPMAAFLEEQGAAFDAAMSRLSCLYDAPNQTMLTLTGGYDSRRSLGWLLNAGIHPTVYTVPDIYPDGREFESAIVRELCRVGGLNGYSISPATTADRLQAGRARDLATDFESDEHVFSAILAMGLNCHHKINYDGLGAGSQLSGAFVKPEYFRPGGDALFLAALSRSVRRWLDMPAVDAPPLATRLRAHLQRWGDNPNRFAYFYLLSRTRREIALAPLSIQANVFESLCPYLDREMMRSALSFPPLAKIGSGVQRRAIAALAPELGQIPTIYSYGINQNPRYRVFRRPLEYGAGLAMLRRVSRFKGAGANCSFGLKQRLRFRAAGALALLGHTPRLRWEIGRTGRIGQLAHFEAISRSPEDYQKAAAGLCQAFGQQSGWCQAFADPLNEPTRMPAAQALDGLNYYQNRL